MNTRTTSLLAALALLVGAGSATFAAVPQAAAPPSPAPTEARAGGPRHAPTSAAGCPAPARGEIARRSVSTDVADRATVGALRRAIAVFNCAGAALHLTLAPSGGDIDLTMIDEFPNEKTGETSLRCGLPCRPVAARIVIERGLDRVALPQVVTHELGHAAGLDHDDGGCAAMYHHVRRDEPCRAALARQPLQDRDIAALRAIWGTAPRSNRD